MCGIAGWFDREGKAKEAVENALLSLEGRGPDGKKVYEYNKNLAIGQTRLAITGKAELPWIGKKVSIAHNGEIYNWKELSKKFKLKLESNNDSEVIVRFLDNQLNQKKSLSSAVKLFMQHAIGDYAVVGISKDTLFGFRDPVGIRPLWVGQSSRYVGFSSETLNLKVKNCTFPSPIQPGHLTTIKNGLIKDEMILDLKKIVSVQKKGSIKSVHHALKKTIDLQTKDLNHCGILFSGGVDSSLIAQMVINRVKHVTLYSVGLEGSSDLMHAKEAASQLSRKVNHEMVVIKPEEVPKLTMEALKRLERFDLLQTQLAVPMLALAKHISGKERVLFTGQGSDELFGGYKQYQRVFESEGKKGVEQELIREASDWWSRNLDREDRMIASYGIEERFPFWSLPVIKESFSLPLVYKIKSKEDSIRKHAVRQIALIEKLPESIAMRPKHALQYSTGVAKAVEKVLK